MMRKKTQIKGNIKLLTQLSKSLRKNPIAGNLIKVSIPKDSNNFFFRLTWKENQKTKIMYIRNDEIIEVKKGVIEFAKTKKIFNKICEGNRRLILLNR